MRDASLVIAFAAVCLFAPIALALSPRGGEAVAVIAWPWSGVSAPLIVAAAGALLVLDAKAAAFCLRPSSGTRPT